MALKWVCTSTLTRPTSRVALIRIAASGPVVDALEGRRLMSVALANGGVVGGATSAANDVDVYREWAHAIVHGAPERPLSRAYSAGIIALRPSQDGQIHGYSGLEEIQQRYGQWVIDAHLPPAGTGTQPVEAGYMANAWVRMKHPDYDTLRGMLDDVGRTVKVHAG